MAPRTFGATKFRNAVPAIPERNEWYRTCLPSAGAAPVNTSVFSGIVKITREAVVTLTPAGDASVRSYAAVGELEHEVWAGKFGPVADWDVSRLEDGGMLVAGNDGNATYYSLSDAAPSAQHSFSIGGKASSVRLHPTTPGLALITTDFVQVWDVFSSKAVVTLEAPAPLWTASWSPDGRLVGGVSKKGHAYIWDPRAGPSPVQNRDLSAMLQALKPVHSVFIGSDFFITSFSRSRTRQYSLLSPTLSTTFTASVDTSQGPLVPLVDEERRIVYVTGRGDMTLRQIELSGPQGYQEMQHRLPSPLTAGGMAAKHWSTLPVMQAQIASLILPTIDKDGDALLPLAINVPRRQLIDYHADLFPDVAGSVPEQDAAQWIAGGDNAPLPASVDPERRGVWEKAVGEGKKKWAAVGGATAAATAVTGAAVGAAAPRVVSASTPTASGPAPPARPTSPPQPDVDTSAEPISQPDSISKHEPAPALASKASPPAPGLPPLNGDETYSSTEYKVRLIGERVVEFQKAHAATGSKAPLMVGLQGPQGCGKTTLCDALVSSIQSSGMRVAVLSLDDLYRTHDDLEALARKHPNNPLLSGRGPPGTHDVELAKRVLSAISGINVSSSTVELPVFDKSLCSGEGDRSSETVSVSAPLDVFILEGWSFGFHPLSSSELQARLEAKDGKYFPKYDAQSLIEINDYLAEFAREVYPSFKALIQVEPDTYEHVFAWRLQQEHAMKEVKGQDKGMTDDQVHAFVERYMPSYELWAAGVVDENAPWAGQVVRLRYGKEREVTAVESPLPVPKAKDTKTSPKEEKATPAEPTAVATPATAAVPVAAPIAAVAALRTDTGSPSPSTYATAPTTPKPASPAPSQTSAAAQAQASASAPPPAPIKSPVSASEPYNPGWSRKYLASKTPLNPTYDQIPSVATLHQDSAILHVSPNLAFFPVQAPGGRVLVHPLAKKGRLPFGGVGFVAGGVALADFAADPFSDRVVCAGEDGVLRVWNLPSEGVEGAGPEPDVVRGSGVERIVKIAFHPTAKDLLLVASNEHGSSHLRFFDLSTSQEAKVIDLPAPVTSLAISDSGQRVALPTKDGRLVVVDRQGRIVDGRAHDSARPAQVAWVGEDHLLTLGFGRGSMRQVHLYTVSSTVERTVALSLDVSPSVLFPVYDAETHILYAWGKGQQNIQTFQIDTCSSGAEPITKLPSFTAGSPQLAVAFLPKSSLDVRKVQVAKALRLTARSIEEVTFTVPRNRPQFFQDDIYVPTRDGKPTATASKWLAGEPGLPGYVSLCPRDMTPLSAAPAQNTQTKTKFVPAAKVMSEEERKQKAMDDLFARAKDFSDSEEDDEPRRGGIAAPDDDWD